MAIETGTLQTNIEEVEDKIKQYQTGGAPLLQKSFLKVLARVFGLLLFGIKKNNKKHLETNLFLDSADEDIVLRQGNRFGFSLKQATQSSGNVVVTFSGSGILPIGSKLSRSDGEIFVTQSQVSRTDAGTQTVRVVSENVGTLVNTDANTSFSLLSIIAGVSSAIVDGVGLSSGADIETIEQFRTRLKARETLTNTTVSGTRDYYSTLAKGISGVEFVTIFGGKKGSENFCNGVTVVCEGSNQGEISESILTAVSNAIKNDGNAYVSSIDNIFVYSINRSQFNFGLDITPDTQENRDSITTLLTDYLNSTKLQQVISASAIISAISPSGVTVSIASATYYDNDNSVLKNLGTQVNLTFFNRAVVGLISFQ